MWIDDNILKECEKPIHLDIWSPRETIVVGGSSNDLSRESNLETCEKDKISAVKRTGGGGCVVLHEGCIIISLGCWVNRYYNNDYFFKTINQSVIECLAGKWPSLSGLSQNGISDIAFGVRKIAGTSLFRSRNFLLYQASILLENHLELIERYLKHPSKEPEYRQGKIHKDFLTSLKEIDPSVSKDLCLSHLRENLLSVLQENLKEDLCPVKEDQVAHLLKKSKREEELEREVTDTP